VQQATGTDTRGGRQCTDASDGGIGADRLQRIHGKREWMVTGLPMYAVVTRQYKYTGEAHNNNEERCRWQYMAKMDRDTLAVTRHIIVKRAVNQSALTGLRVK